MWEGWTALERPVSFKRVKMVQEFENKIRPVPSCIHSVWVLNFLNRVTVDLREKNCSRYHDIDTEKKSNIAGMTRALKFEVKISWRFQSKVQRKENPGGGSFNFWVSMSLPLMNTKDRSPGEPWDSRPQDSLTPANTRLSLFQSPPRATAPPSIPEGSLRKPCHCPVPVYQQHTQMEAKVSFLLRDKKW